MNEPRVKPRRKGAAAQRVCGPAGPPEVVPCPAIEGDGGADSCERAIAEDQFWDAFEPDGFGGPEDEPQPEYGDFCYEPDDPEGMRG